jgi:hypothetical protein
LKKNVEKYNEFQLIGRFSSDYLHHCAKQVSFLWYSMDEVKPEKVGLTLNKK